MKKWILFLIVIFAAVFGRNFLFSSLFSYEVIKERKLHPFESENFKDDEDAGEAEEMIKNSLKQTSSVLAFSFGPCENDPSLLLKTKKANCIGYSAFMASSVREKLKKSGLSDDWEAVHVVGKIYFLNENINQYFTSEFFKDHDFVIIKNRKTKELIAVDPALYDYFRIDKIKLK